MNTSRNIILITSCLMLVLFFTFFFQNKSYNFEGRITSNYNYRLSKLDEMQLVTISSTGGDPDVAEIAAQIIRNKKFSIIVDGLCFSSCVEYLLPAANSLIMSKRSIIGLHQNPTMFEIYKDKNASYRDIDLCHFEDNIVYYEDLQSKKGNGYIHDKALNEIISKLVVEDYVTKEKDDCIEVGFRFRNQLWLPDSNQLRNILGFEFQGSVCADNFEYCSQVIDKILPSDYPVIIGNDEYRTGQ